METSWANTLDNPVWTAFLTGNKALNAGNEQVKFFPAGVAPFAALATYDAASLYALYELLPDERAVALITTEKLAIPAYWEVVEQMDVVQLICTEWRAPDVQDPEAIPLTPSQVPAMLALTALTHPGPFLIDTISLGGYYGLFEAGRLAAMAGYRLDTGQFREISAVCTHPDFTGRGYASRLVHHLKNRNSAQFRFSFLHVKGDNRSLVQFYERLGFEQRAVLHLSVLKKASFGGT